MTKKFTKGCAVDLRGQSKLVKNTIFRKVGCDFSHMKDDSYIYNFIRKTEISGAHLSNSTDGMNEILTPTDILGPELVKAIEEGCIPYYEEIDGTNLHGFKLRLDGKGEIIAYEPSKAFSIQAKTLSEKVGSSILSRSYEDLTSLKLIHDELEKLTATEEARAANLPYVQGIIDQLRGE